MRYKIVIWQFLFVFIFGLLSVNNVSAQSTWEKTDVDPHHNWTIKFNTKANSATVNKNTIYVKNHSGEIIDDINVYLNEDNLSATVEAPDEGYQLGSTYTLFVTTNVESQNNKTLQNEVTMQFTIKQDYTSNILENLVTLPSSEYDVAESERMLARIARIPDMYLYSLVENDVEIRLVNHPITNEPEWSHLKGVVPRGWEATGKTWDDVPGVGGGSPTIVRIGYSDFNMGHGTLNLELHEIAHTIDYQLFGGISNSDQFKDILEKEMQHLMIDHPSAENMYYFYYPEEYFAECFVYYYLSDETRNELKQKAPLTYQFIQQLEQWNKGTVLSLHSFATEEPSLYFHNFFTLILK